MFENTGALYVLAISVASYSILVNKQVEWDRRKEIVCHCAILTYSVTMAIIPFVSPANYEKSGLSVRVLTSQYRSVVLGS